MPSKLPQQNMSFPNICIIGAGVAGLCAAIQLKRKLGISNFTIFDVNEDVGGTWLVNKYPGCACDVPSHLYSLSFELNPDWSESFSSSDEIQTYWRNIAEKYDLYPSIRFRSQVKSLEWDEAICKWRVAIANLNDGKNLPETRIFDIVINGPGTLRVPNYPEEFMSFEGPILHSAEWDSSVELENKVVAVIGNGASAVQMIPVLAKKVKELHLYQRKPTWVFPRNQFRFSRGMKFFFAYVPLFMRLYRWLNYCTWERLYPLLIGNSSSNKKGSMKALKYMHNQLGGNEQLIKDLTPNYTLGCKRIAITSDYFNCFKRANVKLHRNKIAGVTENSILTENGETTKIDILILATGFKVQDYFAPMQIIGKNKENVLQTWKETVPSTFFGIMTNPTPNHFMLLGPHSILGNNSLIFMAECQVDFITAVIKELVRTGSKSVTVKAEAEKEFMDDLKKNLKSMVWATGQCGSWYENSKGEVTAIWPWPSSTYWWRTRTVDFSKLEFS